MTTANDLLRSKGHQIWSVEPDTTVYEAIEIMADKGIGSILVMKDDNLKGILTERDYTCKVILKGRSSTDTPVKDIMTSKVLHAKSDSTIDECMALMTKKRVRHLPVYEDDKLIGIISIGDIVKEIISEQKIIIEQLENYIYS